MHLNIYTLLKIKETNNKLIVNCKQPNKRRYERNKPVKNGRHSTRYRMFLPSRPRERKDLWTSREAYRAQAGDTVDSLHKQAMNMALGSEQLIVSARHGVG